MSSRTEELNEPFTKPLDAVDEAYACGVVSQSVAGQCKLACHRFFESPQDDFALHSFMPHLS
jgi:hypothetical protein